MRIANGVEMLELTAEMGQTNFFNATLIWDEQDVILVDAGLPNMQQVIQNKLEELGVPFARLNKVIVTHHDMDHLGSLPNLIVAATQKIEVLAHESEKPYIEGTEHLLTKIEKSIVALPAEQQEQRRQAYLARQTVVVDTVLIDGQELPFCGGIVVIHTPGHTPGHISLYHKQSKTVITGDSTVAEEGKLLGPSPIFSVDLPEAIKSLKKLTNYDVEHVICYHGGIVTENANQQINDLQTL
ncbi:MAG: MBL fold metallo-hydrolase [Firmicutes bacterium]|nr:MBL fold metallo-hydrolase [Bacillota bacterium]